MTCFEGLTAIFVALTFAFLGRRSADTLLSKADGLHLVALLCHDDMALRWMGWRSLGLVVARDTDSSETLVFAHAKR